MAEKLIDIDLTEWPGEELKAKLRAIAERMNSGRVGGFAWGLDRAQQPFDKRVIVGRFTDRNDRVEIDPTILLLSSAEERGDWDRGGGRDTEDEWGQFLSSEDESGRVVRWDFYYDVERDHLIQRREREGWYPPMGAALSG